MKTIVSGFALPFRLLPASLAAPWRPRTTNTRSTHSAKQFYQKMDQEKGGGGN